MKIQERFSSIQFRLSVMLCFSIAIVILLMILVNNVILESYYKFSKIETAKNVCSEINRYYNGAIQYDIKPQLKEIEIKNNIEIYIENEYREVIYESNKNIIGSIEKLRKGTPQANTIYKKDNVIIKNVDTSSINRYMMLQANLDNGYNLYIKISVIPIKESVKIANSTLIFIGAMMIAISAIMATVISRRVTAPIVQLNNITKKMAKLDFSKKYVPTDTDDDINKLGKNINEMSEKLEITIGQLRKNNNELERDIEEKAKIDEMRKQFISDVSHELKTPIALIQGYAEGLLENVNDDEESRKFYADVIVDESKKMDKMVKQLLELMKLEYQERKFNDTEFDLNELIKEELRRETVVINEKNIEIEFNDTEKVMVYADQDCISQVIENFTVNAIKHCEEKNKEKKISIKTIKRNDKIRLSIFNTGDKISDEYINKIWGRFYKVDSSRSRENGGTGIGLAIVKAIMNNYNNEYGAKNLENGVEFYCDINTKKQN